MLHVYSFLKYWQRKLFYKINTGSQNNSDMGINPCSLNNGQISMKIAQKLVPSYKYVQNGIYPSVGLWSSCCNIVHLHVALNMQINWVVGWKGNHVIVGRTAVVPFLVVHCYYDYSVFVPTWVHMLHRWRSDDVHELPSYQRTCRLIMKNWNMNNKKYLGFFKCNICLIIYHNFFLQWKLLNFF